MERVGEHPVPVGPLAVRWLAYDLPEIRAGATGTARVRLQNAGLAPWRRIRVAYHWLDDLGNPILWDGWRSDFATVVEPGDSLEQEVSFRAPLPPGAYVLAFDLVDEERGWLSEVGNVMCKTTVRVAPRIHERRLEARVLPGPGDLALTTRSLGAQEEPPVSESGEAVAYLVAGCVLPPDWITRVLDTHAEGYAAVGGAVDADRKRELTPWRPAAGRSPSFPHPLLIPSLLEGLEPSTHLGLPAYEPRRDVPSDLTEPWIFDGRIRLRLQRD